MSPLALALLTGTSLGAAVLLVGRHRAPRARLPASPAVRGVRVAGSRPDPVTTGSAVGGPVARWVLPLVARARRLAGPDVPAALAGVSSLAAELAALLRAGLGPAAAWHHAAAAATGPTTTGPAGATSPTGGAGEPGSRGSARGAAAAEVSAAARAAAASARSGGDTGRVLREAASRSEVPAPLLRLAAAWEVAARTGAPTADVLDALSGALASEREELLGVRAALAGPRASALVLALLPLAGVGLGLLMGVNPVGVLVGTTVGRVCALVGIGLASGGWWWTSRMVAAASRVR